MSVSGGTIRSANAAPARSCFVTSSACNIPALQFHRHDPVPFAYEEIVTPGLILCYVQVVAIHIDDHSIGIDSRQRNLTPVLAQLRIVASFRNRPSHVAHEIVYHVCADLSAMRLPTSDQVPYSWSAVRP